ncbi:DHA2 family efflux MFS transporter permease subunit [Ornithinimicrobium sp. Arc0846-15]|nr:DHA2 family efflux MFS transporter permease subunit [Ornithinimicrobium laminariae]
MGVIWLLLAAAFVVILNETLLAVALPVLQVELGVSESAIQWLTSGFMLTMAVVIPITGFLIQRLSTRTLFATALGLFSTGTLIAATAPGFEFLLLGRIVQATGTAVMMPLLMTTVMTLVPAKDRGRIMGRVSIVISVAPAMGPTISGVLLNTLGWRSLFLMMLPIALVMLLIGLRFISNISEPRALSVDLLSVVLSGFGFGGLVYALTQIGESVGGDLVGLFIPLGIGLVSLGLFIWRQIRLGDDALLNLSTFASLNFSLSILLMMTSMMALFGTIVLLPFYLQGVLGLEPLAVGLLLLPGGLMMGLMGPPIGRAFDRVGPRPLLIPGTVIVSSVLWLLTLTGSGTPPWAILAGHVVLSIGLGMLFTPLFTTALGSVQPHLYPHGSAIVGTVQQVAGAAGTALFVTIMSAVQLAQQDLGEIESLSAGISAAFLTGAVISSLGVALTFFIKRPAES